MVAFTILTMVAAVIIAVSSSSDVPCYSKVVRSGECWIADEDGMYQGECDPAENIESDIKLPYEYEEED